MRLCLGVIISISILLSCIPIPTTGIDRIYSATENVSAEITRRNLMLQSITYENSIFSKASKSALYTYHNYTTLVTDTQNLNSTYQNIFELFTAQALFGLPDVPDGAKTYKTWIIRITNESTGFNKPEVLFIGGHHGDETVGVEVAYYLAELLCTNYSTNSWIKYLVDNREIYIMPCANPYGWANLQRYDEHSYDMNRDYPYDFDYSGAASGNKTPLSTIGARAIHELTKRHLFINTVSWHGGGEGIYYAWGCYAHNTAPYECPDDVAFYNEGKYMSLYGGNYSASGPSYYEYGKANDILYPCYGAYEDYAYAASWDLVNENTSYPTNGCRSLTHCIEISSTKNPAASTLGGRADVFTPGGAEDGYVPKNIRIALLLTDTAGPYINITSEIPTEVAPEQIVTFKWKVMGALNTTETNIQWGNNSDPIANYTNTTSNLSGGTGWQNVEYSQTIKMPSQVGDYYFVIRAKVDNNTLNQSTPDPPNTKPQSLYVNMRTNASWNITNYENSMQGKVNWYSQIIHIKVRIPDNDVGICAASLKNGSIYNIGERRINATVKNFGINSQSNFNVSCKIEEILQKCAVIIPLSQNFIGTFPPAGWQKEGTAGSTEWKQSNTANAGGTAPEANFHYGTSGVVSIWRLYAGPIDTSGYTKLKLDWANYLDGYGTGCKIKIETSSNGVNWQNTTWIYETNANIGPGKQTLIIQTTDVGSSTFYFSFTVEGNSYQLDDWWVDDVVLTIEIPTLTQIVLNSNQTISEVLIQNATENLTWDYNFKNATDYQINITVWLSDQNPTNNEMLINIKIAFAINLLKGWNFITLPYSSSYNAETLAQNISNCSYISRWNSSMQKFEIHERNSSANNFSIESGIGYFVYVSESSVFNLQGKPISNATVYLTAGWNSIGWFNDTATNASELAKKIGNCSAVAFWSYDVDRFCMHLVATGINDFRIERGFGYFVYATKDVIWKN